MTIRKKRRAIVKEELVALLGNHEAALVLDRFLYLAGTKMDLYEAEKNGRLPKKEQYIVMSAAKLTLLILVSCTSKTVLRRLDDLVDAGYLLRLPRAAGWVGADAYWPDFEKIRVNLEALGYTLDDYYNDKGNKEDNADAEKPESGTSDAPKPAAPKAGARHNQPPQAGAAKPVGGAMGRMGKGGWSSTEAAAEFEDIARESEERRRQREAQTPQPEPMSQGEKQEMLNWLAKNAVASKCPDNEKLVSWLLFKHAGLTPSSKVGSWIAQCSALWEASDGSEIILVEAIKAGADARRRSKITLSSPMSFVNFARSAAAEHRLIPDAAIDHGKKPDKLAVMPSGQRQVGNTLVIGGK